MVSARILVVDDEEPLCLVLQDALEMEGYIVETCNTIGAAREKLAKTEFDAALLDVFLTDEPLGIALAKQIMEEHSQTTVVFMTGFAHQADILDGYAHGAFGCIRKPFDLDDVLRVLGMATENK